MFKMGHNFISRIRSQKIILGWYEFRGRVSPQVFCMCAIWTVEMQNLGETFRDTSFKNYAFCLLVSLRSSINSLSSPYLVLELRWAFSEYFVQCFWNQAPRQIQGLKIQHSHSFLLQEIWFHMGHSTIWDFDQVFRIQA